MQCRPMGCLPESGAEINPKDRSGLRQKALARGGKEIVELLDNGADANTQEV